MKSNEINIFLFIASIIIGILISMNISFETSSNGIVLTANQYKEAYNERNKLQAEISNIKNQYNEDLEKLEKYKEENPSSEKIIEDLSKELNSNKMLLGTTDVSGKGLKITMDDASAEVDLTNGNDIEMWSSLIHNTDIMLVLTSLRNGGSEAISINGQRVLNLSEVYCFGQFIRVNGENLPAPFVINVIGDPDVIKNYILNEDLYLKTMRDLRGIQVDIETSDNINIPAYTGEVKYEYMKEVEK